MQPPRRGLRSGIVDVLDRKPGQKNQEGLPDEKQILGRIVRLAGTPRDHEPHGVKAMKTQSRSGRGPQ